MTGVVHSKTMVLDGYKWVARAQVTVTETRGYFWEGPHWAWFTCWRPAFLPLQDDGGFFPGAPLDHALHFIPGTLTHSYNYMVNVVVVVTYCDHHTHETKNAKFLVGNAIELQEIHPPGLWGPGVYLQVWFPATPKLFHWEAP